MQLCAWQQVAAVPLEAVQAYAGETDAPAARVTRSGPRRHTRWTAPTPRHPAG